MKQSLKTGILCLLLISILVVPAWGQAEANPELVDVKMSSSTALSVEPLTLDVVWKPNGYTERCRLQVKYGGKDNPDGVISEAMFGMALEVDRPLREDGSITNYDGRMAMEPGALYAFRIVSETGEALTPWMDKEVPQNHLQEVGVGSIDIPAIPLSFLATMRREVAKLQAGDMSADIQYPEASIHLLVPASVLDGGEIIYVIASPSGRRVWAEGGGRTLRGGEYDDYLSDSLGDYFRSWDETTHGPIETGNYTLRVYAEGALAGEYAFTVKP